MTVTRDQAQMLAELARASRPNGASRWDTGGIMAAIKQVADRDLATVVMAVIRAASDRDVDSPGVIPSNGTHWAESASVTTYTPKPYDATGTCGTCSMPEAKCRARWREDHEYEPADKAMARKGELDVHRTVAALKSELAPIAPRPEPITLAERVAGLPRDERLEAVRASLRADPTPQPPGQGDSVRADREEVAL